MAKNTEMDLITELGTLIIALIALVQPWIIYLWKRFIKPGKLDFFETGTIEIGFSNYASTIGINGTIRSTDKDFYISNISLELIKEKDYSKHHFDWAVFRDTKISLSDNQNTDVELPYGILLKTQSPERVNIQFHDRKQQEDLSKVFNNLSHEWNNFLDTEFPYNQRITSTNLENETYKVFEKFSSTPFSTESFGKIQREFYWEEGKYNLILKIQTSEPDKIFSKKFKFILSEDECKNLRYNILTLHNLACEQTRFNWNFALTNYQY